MFTSLKAFKKRLLRMVFNDVSKIHIKTVVITGEGIC